MTAPSPIKIIRIVERNPGVIRRLLATLIWLAAVAYAFYFNHVYVGDSFAFGALLFLLGLITLLGIARWMANVDVTMTEDEAFIWLQARRLK